MKRVAIDIECESLTPTLIWVIVCRDLDTNEVEIFREPTRRQEEKKRFLAYAETVNYWTGHNLLGFDVPVLRFLLSDLCINPSACVDTLVVSRLVDYSRPGGHSLEQWGQDLGYPKTKFTAFHEFSEEMVNYCVQDTLVSSKVHKKLEPYITSSLWKEALRTEHDMAIICHEMHTNGFGFDLEGSHKLHSYITKLLGELELEIKESFKPKATLVRVIEPKLTKYGTLHKGDFRWVEDGDLSPYSAGAPFSRIKFEEFNPGSAKQRVERLNEAGWKPFEKTDGHKECEMALRRRGIPRAEREQLKEKLANFKIYGWTTSEDNLATLPASAPEGARKLVQWLVLDRRRSTLEEWQTAVSNAPRAVERPSNAVPTIHGNFNHIGAWTHRMSHNSPNTANISTFHGLPKTREPTPVELIKAEIDPQLRSFFTARADRWLVGVDAESIQLRVLAHYMEDSSFTESLLTGDKKDGTDPHSMNWKALGKNICQGRDDAKTFIYAWLLGAGTDKIASILRCSLEEARIAVQNFLDFYPGLRYLKEEIIPYDASRGYFQGFDGRYVKCDSEHLMLAGYLQNGETVIMKKACTLWNQQLRAERIPFWQVNMVHDEFITEALSYDDALHIAKIQANAIKTAGELYQLKCPMAGSYMHDTGKYTIGKTWAETH